MSDKYCWLTVQTMWSFLTMNCLQSHYTNYHIMSLGPSPSKLLVWFYFKTKMSCHSFYILTSSSAYCHTNHKYYIIKYTWALFYVPQWHFLLFQKAKEQKTHWTSEWPFKLSSKRNSRTKSVSSGDGKKQHSPFQFYPAIPYSGPTRPWRPGASAISYEASGSRLGCCPSPSASFHTPNPPAVQVRQAEKRRWKERERCQYWMSVHTVNNSQYRRDFLHVQSLHQNEYIPWLLTIILSLWYGISSIHEDIT